MLLGFSQSCFYLWLFWFHKKSSHNKHKCGHTYMAWHWQILQPSQGWHWHLAVRAVGEDTLDDVRWSGAGRSINLCKEFQILVCPKWVGAFSLKSKTTKGPMNGQCKVPNRWCKSWLWTFQFYPFLKRRNLPAKRRNLPAKRRNFFQVILLIHNMGPTNLDALQIHSRLWLLFSRQVDKWKRGTLTAFNSTPTFWYNVEHICARDFIKPVQLTLSYLITRLKATRYLCCLAVMADLGRSAFSGWSSETLVSGMRAVSDQPVGLMVKCEDDEALGHELEVPGIESIWRLCFLCKKVVVIVGSSYSPLDYSWYLVACFLLWLRHFDINTGN